MTDIKLIRWGIIGCGDVTELKSGPPYRMVQGFSLNSVMRRDLVKAQEYAQRHAVEKYTSNADELINDPTIDAIYIATPPDSHKYYGIKVAEAGKICCIEKPLSPSYNDSLAIVEAFEKAEKPLFVAYYRRSMPRFVAVKNWLDQHFIGEVRHVNWQLSKQASTVDISKEYNWRTDAKIATGGYFDDLASHGLDLIAFLLGDFEEVKGICTNQQGLYTAYDAISACWIHKNGITGSGSWNFGASTTNDVVEIIGSTGFIQFSVFDDAPIILKSISKNEELIIPHHTNVQYQHIEKMRDCLLNGIQHPSMGKSGLHTSWVLDKILGKI